MLVMQRGLVAASWVAGRRRVTREGTEREGRERRRKGSGGTEVEHGTAVMDVDTPEDSSLRSRIGDEAGEIGSHGEVEAVVADLAPQAPSHAEGDGGEKTSVKRKRQTEKGRSGPKAAEDVIEKGGRNAIRSHKTLASPHEAKVLWSDEYPYKHLKNNVILNGEKEMTSYSEKGDDHIEKTKKKAGENTMKERLEGDEGIE